MTHTPEDQDELRALARRHGADAIATLAAIMADPEVSASPRVTAAIVLLERGWGKPTPAAERAQNIFDDLSPETLRAVDGALAALAQEPDKAP